MTSTATIPNGRRQQMTGITRRVVVALDGRVSSDAALVAASHLVPPPQIRVLSIASAPRLLADDTRAHSATDWIGWQRERTEAQVNRLLGDGSDVRIDIRTGPTAPAIAAYAESVGGSLLVTGLGDPNVRDRLLGDELALHIARFATIPVLGVSRHGGAPPMRVIVAVDSSAASRRAIQAVTNVAAPDARILLVHVRAPSIRPMLASTLATHADTLRRGHFGRVEFVELRGDPATELLAFANELGADLLVMGKRSDAPRPRGVMGGVASRTIRCTQCSFLAVPA